VNAKMIVLVKDLPVDPVHEMKAGNVYEIRKTVLQGVVVSSAATGEDITVLRHEYKLQNNSIASTPLTDGVVLRRDANGESETNVPWVVVAHSPDGFEWGYGGSGPADLALNIAEHALKHLGYEGNRQPCYKGDCFGLAWEVHQDLKRKFIAQAPREGTVIPWQDILDFVQDYIDVQG
jgi:hypothetical protein